MFGVIKRTLSKLTYWATHRTGQDGRKLSVWVGSFLFLQSQLIICFGCFFFQNVCLSVGEEIEGVCLIQVANFLLRAGWFYRIFQVCFIQEHIPSISVWQKVEQTSSIACETMFLAEGQTSTKYFFLTDLNGSSHEGHFRPLLFENSFDFKSFSEQHIKEQSLQKWSSDQKNLNAKNVTAPCKCGQLWRPAPYSHLSTVQVQTHARIHTHTDYNPVHHTPLVLFFFYLSHPP